MKQLNTNVARFIDSAKVPMTWWSQYGMSAYPVLYKIAKLVFGIPTSQAASERVWSAYGFMLAKLRNRMLPETLTDLVQLYINGKNNNLIEIMTGVESEVAVCEDDQNGD